MAEIQIILEDKGDGVKVTATPNCQMIVASALADKRQLTGAEMYALAALTHLTTASKSLDKYQGGGIITPDQF